MTTTSCSLDPPTDVPTKPKVLKHKARWVFWCPAEKEWMSLRTQNDALGVARRCAQMHYPLPIKPF